MIGKHKISVPRYKFIIKNVIFSEPKKEKEIFDLIIRGYTNMEIGYKVGMSTRTIYRRKRDIIEKILPLL